MLPKHLLRPRLVFLVVVTIAILLGSVGMFMTQQGPPDDRRLLHNVYFGEPAHASDLLIDTASGSSTDLFGKWAVESINKISVAPAADWLEKPAIVHLNFEVRDDEIILSGYSGCNSFGGKAYVLDGNLQTPELVRTQRGCPPPLLSQENTLFRILSSPSIWTALQTLSKSTIVVGTEDIGFVQLRRLFN